MLNLLIVYSLLMTSTLFAQSFKLTPAIYSPSKINQLIGAQMPKPGSAEDQQDFKTILEYQKNRTAADCANATNDMDTSLQAMFGGSHKILTDAEISKMTSFLMTAKVSAGSNIGTSKAFFKRPRPYNANPAVKPCIKLEGSFAYPSGHSTLVQLYARILSEVYPERAEQLMNRAAEYSLNRVIGGVHHPTDVVAAHVMADDMAKKMIKTQAFLEALDAL